MVNIFRPDFRLLITFCFIGALCCSECFASEARLSFVPQDNSTPESFSLVIDKADKIAGLKVSIVYDKTLLSFKKAEKSKATSSFLHVVNDKNPGRLIIVMASAKGVSGENLPLLHLSFEKVDSDANPNSSLKVTEIQLMTESLKEVKANLPEYHF